MLPQLVDTGFQVLFHSPPGVLFTFPSQYFSLSVTRRYSALRGGPRSFSRDSSCPGLLRILPRAALFRVRGSHPLRPAFPKPFPFPAARPAQSVPRGACTAVWALPVPLAATPGIDVSFSSSGYLDVSVRRVPLHALCVGAWIHGGFPHVGFPIQTPADHRACAPPRSFSQLVASFVGS